jgi:hypothetical protein
MLPLYEAKMIHLFDHRWASFSSAGIADLSVSDKEDPDCVAMPRYWIDTAQVVDRLAPYNWQNNWMLGWRDICRSTDVRTLIATISRGEAGYEGGTLLAFPPGEADAAVCLVGCFASFVLDFVARQKIGGTHLKNFTMRQLPVLPPLVFYEECPWHEGATVGQWLTDRVIELTYTAWDMEAFARDLEDHGTPFRWEEERRLAMRAELDAAFFHLYGIGRDNVDYIMETFPIFKRKDEQRYGSFRTKELILDVYDAVAAAMRTGVPYQTILDPAPGRGPRHPARRNT